MAHWLDELDAQKLSVIELMKDEEQRKAVWHGPELKLSGYGAGGKSYTTLTVGLIEAAPIFVKEKDRWDDGRVILHVWTRKTGSGIDHPATLSFHLNADAAKKIAAAFLALSEDGEAEC